jgi:hypothetical protein
VFLKSCFPLVWADLVLIIFPIQLNSTTADNIQRRSKVDLCAVQAMGGWLVWLYYLDPMAWSLYGVVGSQLGDIDNEFISYADGTTVTIKEFTRLAEIRSLIPDTNKKGNLRNVRT